MGNKKDQNETEKDQHTRLCLTCPLRPLAVTCGHLPSAATCGHLRPLALCGHLRSLTVTGQVWSVTCSSGHLRPLCKWPRITKYIAPDHVPSGRWPLEFVVTEKVGDFPGKVMENVGHFPRYYSYLLVGLQKGSMEREFCDIVANQPVSQ